MSVPDTYRFPWPSPTSPSRTVWTKQPINTSTSTSISTSISISNINTTATDTQYIHTSVPSPRISQHSDEDSIPELSNSRSSSMGQYCLSSSFSDRDTDLDDEMRYLGITAPNGRYENYQENPYFCPDNRVATGPLGQGSGFTYGGRAIPTHLHYGSGLPGYQAHNQIITAASPDSTHGSSAGRTGRLFQRLERKSNQNSNNVYASSNQSASTVKPSGFRPAIRQAFTFSQNKSSFVDRTPPRVAAPLAGATSIQQPAELRPYAASQNYQQYQAPAAVAIPPLPTAAAAAAAAATAAATSRNMARPSFGARPSHPYHNHQSQTTQTLPAVPQSHMHHHPPSELLPALPYRASQRKQTYPKPGDVQLRIIPPAPHSRTVCDDEDSHYIVEPGTMFADRYVLVRLLGQGTFGRVAEAVDEITQQRVAIKIIRAIPKYRDASRIELRVLSLLTQSDVNNDSQCVKMLDCFDYRNHVCLVMDLLDTSLYDFLKLNDFAPFPSYHVQSFARQLLKSISFLHKLGLIHTDIKPENILLDSSEVCDNITMGRRSTGRQARILRDSHITLIDFGSAVFSDEYHSSVVSTRHYRAPEIVLGTGWDAPCDMWSLGCLLIELCTGVVLYQTRDDLEHLHTMECTLEQRFDGRLAAEACKNTTGRAFFDASGNRLKPLTSHKQMEALASCHPIRALVMASVPYSRERSFWDGFIDLLTRLLQLDPNNRLTAEQALHHPWVSGF